MSMWDDLSSDFGLDCGGCERCHHGAGDQCPSVEVDDLRKRVAELERQRDAQNVRVAELNTEANALYGRLTKAKRERDEARRMWCQSSGYPRAEVAAEAKGWSYLYHEDDEG